MATKTTPKTRKKTAKTSRISELRATARQQLSAAEDASKKLLNKGSELGSELGEEIRDRAGEAVSSSVTAGRNLWLAGLGALAETGEKGKELFDDLVAKGETFQARQRKAVDETLDRTFGRVEEEGKKARKWVSRRWETTVDGAAETVSHNLERFGVPTHGDIQGLSQRVEALTAKVETLAAAR